MILESVRVMEAGVVVILCVKEVIIKQNLNFVFNYKLPTIQSAVHHYLDLMVGMLFVHLEMMECLHLEIHVKLTVPLVMN